MGKNLSPHVTIYKFPITAISSIATRISGLYLSGLFIGGGIVKLVDKEKEVTEIYKNIPDIPKKLFHYSIIAPITYHSYGGIRHFIWDKYPNQLLKNHLVRKSSYFLFGATALSSLAIENFITNYKS